MTIRAEISPTAALFNTVFDGTTVKGNLSVCAQVQLLEGHLNDESLWRCATWKPGRPNLEMPARRTFRGALEVVHKQIAEPPRSASVRQATAHEPDFVAPAHAWCGVDGVEFGLVQRQPLAVVMVPVS